MVEDEERGLSGEVPDEPQPVVHPENHPREGERDSPPGPRPEVLPLRRFGPAARDEVRPRRLWRHLPPAAGLALMLGCLWNLLCNGPLPSWRPWWLNGPGPARAGGVSVVIDPGHGGGDSGAVAHGMVEKDLNLDVGLRVARVLRSQGVVVWLTREDDHFVPLEDRVRQANALPGAIFVSIHFNDASGDGKAAGRASGIETFYSETKEAPPTGWVWASLLGGAKGGVSSNQPGGGAWAVREGQTLADTIQGSLISGTAAADRGIKERGLYVTRRVMGPAVLVEGGFVSHPAESKLLGDPAYRQKLADSVAAGILRYLESSRLPSAAGTVATARAGG